MRVITKRKCALCRTAGKKLYLKGDRCHMEKCAMTRRNYPPGVHGANARGRKTEYGRQLLEKQKVRNVYGMGEAQFQAYVKKAESMKGLAAANLWNLLEKRLDNIIYRNGFATSRSHSRQMVNHGLVKVNGRKVNKASYQVKKNDEISVKDSVLKGEDLTVLVKRNLKDRTVPNWMKFDTKALATQVVGEPNFDDVEKDLSLVTVIEYYSRR